MLDGTVIPAEFEFKDEAVSGTKVDRDGLQRMLEAARSRQFSVLYFENLSRLARELVISMQMLKDLVYNCGVRFISIDEGIDSANAGWDMHSIFVSMHHERYITDLGKYVLRGQEEALRGGFSVGDLCFGYRSVCVDGSEQGRRGSQCQATEGIRNRSGNRPMGPADLPLVRHRATKPAVDHAGTQQLRST